MGSLDITNIKHALVAAVSQATPETIHAAGSWLFRLRTNSLFTQQGAAQLDFEGSLLGFESQIHPITPGQLQQSCSSVSRG